MNAAAFGRSAALSLAVLLLVAECSASGAPSSQPASSPSSRPSSQQTSAPATQPADGGASVGPGASMDPGTSADPGTGDGTDYCTVFTADRLASVVGQPVHVGDNSLLYGMGCRWDTADGKGGVLIQRLPVHAGYGDIAAEDGQRPVTGVGDGATIGPALFFDAAGNEHDGVIAAALVGDGFASVTIAPPPADDVVIGLLTDLVAATR